MFLITGKNFDIYDIFLSPKIVFILANSETLGNEGHQWDPWSSLFAKVLFLYR